LAILRKFVAGQATTASAVADALAAGDRATAERLAHTLRGVAGNIGAGALAALAGELEAAIHAGQPPEHVERLREAVGRALGELLAALTAALPAVDAAPAGVAEAVADAATDAAQAAKVLDRLRALLADDDSAAAEFLESNAETLRAALGEAFGEIAQAVGNFDFDTAMARLQAIRTGG
ncbi:MAG TPA: Hpt domain-containing protein, partial [Azospira sp.]|nr:Hpt domain-containing protein [Azospira sp.]